MPFEIQSNPMIKSGEKLGKLIDLERRLDGESTKIKNYRIWIKIHGEINE